MSAPAASSTTATHTAWFEKAADTWPLTASFWAIESEIADAASSRTAPAIAVAAAHSARGNRVSAPSATPAAIPAGSHATTMRISGWASPPASCCSGSAPWSSGPERSK